MGTRERKEREKEQMRRMILDSAMQLFIEEGYENVQIRKITDKIEYSPGTFYLYFKDKDDVFFNLHEEGFQELMNRMQTIKDIENPLDRLHKLGVIYIDFALEKPEYYEIMFILRSPMKEIGDNEWNSGYQTFNILHDTVDECIKQGKLKSDNSHVSSMIMWSLVHGFVSLIIRDRLKMVPKDQLAPMIEGYKYHLKNMILERI